MTITNEVINKTTSDYNLFLLLKQNMINGEIKLPNLSSKNRSLLHRVCYNYGLEHFSTGNYTNRIIIIKDSQHTYFSNDTNQNKKETCSKSMYNYLITKNEHKKQVKQIEDEVEDEYEVEDEVEDDEEDEVEDDEEDEEVDTDTYSSDESESSENLNSFQILQNSNIIDKLNTLHVFSYINFAMSIIIICNL